MIFDKLFKTNFQRHVERKARLENHIELLKNQQKVKTENVIASYNSRKTQHSNNVEAQITALKNQIENLKVEKKTQAEAFDKEREIAIKKVDNEYYSKILAKKNEVKKLTNLIEKEQKDIGDFVNPEKPNAPRDNRKILNEGK